MVATSNVEHGVGVPSWSGRTPAATSAATA